MGGNLFYFRHNAASFEMFYKKAVALIEKALPNDASGAQLRT
jgi:hypothetical protein